MPANAYKPIELPPSLVNRIRGRVRNLEKMRQQDPKIFNLVVLSERGFGSRLGGTGRAKKALANAIQTESRNLYENFAQAIWFVFGTSSKPGAFSAKSFITRTVSYKRKKPSSRHMEIDAVRGSLKQALVSIHLSKPAKKAEEHLLEIRVADLSKEASNKNRPVLSARFSFEAWQRVIANLQLQFNRYVLYDQISYTPPKIARDSFFKFHNEFVLKPEDTIITPRATKGQLKKNYKAINVSKLGMRKYEPLS